MLRKIVLKEIWTITYWLWLQHQNRGRNEFVSVLIFFHSICYWFMPSAVYTNNIYIISMKAQPSETRFRHFDFMLSYRTTRQYLIFINFYLIRRPLKGTIRHVSSFLQNNSIKWYSHWNEWFIEFKYFLQF